MKPNIDYASEIKALLTEKGLNQKELAQELGTSYINVNKTLNGHTMTPKNRDRYLAALSRLEAKKENQRLRDKLRRIQAIIDEDRQNGIAKAEQFIRDYTKRCSNELTDGSYHEWLTPDKARRAVEIALEEKRG